MNRPILLLATVLTVGLVAAGCADSAGTAQDGGARYDGSTLPGLSFGDASSPLDGGGTVRPDAAVLDAGSVPPGFPAQDAGPGVPGAGKFVPAKPLPQGKDYSGWTWVATEGSTCRDGSKAGYYYRLGTSPNLVVYLNGGGACADPFFCGLNPVNVDQDLPIELLIGGAPNLIIGPNPIRQIAPDEGIFKRDPRNPVADWNMIYVPYCTGDIHGGSNRDVEVPGVAGKQQFTGYINYGLFLDSFGPSFSNVKRVLLTGSSAGGFGTLVNFDRMLDFFGQWNIPVIGVPDSGVPFRIPGMALCLQKRWRTLWGLEKAFPKACTDCLDADKGITETLGRYMFKERLKDVKMPGGVITTVNDQIIRAFFAPGLSSQQGQPDDCTVNPGLNTITSSMLINAYPGEKYQAAMKDVIDNVVGRDRIAFYAMSGENHMHLWRPRFFEKNGNTQSIAEWLADVLAEKPTHQGNL